MTDTAREAGTSSQVMYSYGPPHMAEQKQDDKLEPTYSSSVRIQDVALRTYQKRWMIGRSGEKGSGISVLAARHDDDDDFYSHLLFSRVDWDSRIHRLPLCRWVRQPSTTSVLDMTLNNLMAKLQAWRFGECGVLLHCYCSQVHLYQEWYHMIGSYLWIK